jgi:hypothetical protein
MEVENDNLAIGSALANLINHLIQNKVITVDQGVGTLATAAEATRKADMGKIGPQALDEMAQLLRTWHKPAGRA